MLAAARTDGPTTGRIHPCGGATLAKGYHPWTLTIGTSSEGDERAHLAPRLYGRARRRCRRDGRGEPRPPRLPHARVRDLDPVRAGGSARRVLVRRWRLALVAAPYVRTR